MRSAAAVVHQTLRRRAALGAAPSSQQRTVRSIPDIMSVHVQDNTTPCRTVVQAQGSQGRAWPGKPTHTYGAFAPPYTEKPSSVNARLRISAFSL